MKAENCSGLVVSLDESAEVEWLESSYAYLQVDWIPDYESSEFVNVRDAFNAKPASAGGAAFNGEYWSSTELTNKIVWSVNFSKGGYGAGTSYVMKSNFFRGRAILAF